MKKKHHYLKKKINFPFAIFIAFEIQFIWKGKGFTEKCYFKNNRNSFIEIDKSYYRPLEVDTLLGDSRKARKHLKWKPNTNIKKLVSHMVSEEMNILKND